MCFGFGHLENEPGSQFLCVCFFFVKLENEPGSQLSCVCFFFVKFSCKYIFFGTYHNASGSLFKRKKLKRQESFNESQHGDRSDHLQILKINDSWLHHFMCALALVILSSSPAANYRVSAFSLSSLVKILFLRHLS